jgi:hypothetical protein
LIDWGEWAILVGAVPGVTLLLPTFLQRGKRDIPAW